MPKLSQIELYLDGNYSEEDKKVFFLSLVACVIFGKGKSVNSSLPLNTHE